MVRVPLVVHKGTARGRVPLVVHKGTAGGTPTTGGTNDKTDKTNVQ